MSEAQGTTVAGVVKILDRITGGRMVTSLDELSKGTNRFVVTKSSNIPGKSITEIPGLIVGDPQAAARRIGVCMTLTECHIELAGATQLDVIVAHHPVADAASAGGTPLNVYLKLYNLSLIEIHEAFHGLHPGMAYMHGLTVHKVDLAFRGVPGKIITITTTLPEVHTAGDIIDRLERFIGRKEEEAVLQAEKSIRGTSNLQEALLSAAPYLLHGTRETPVKHVLQVAPHGGLTVEDLDALKHDYPQLDTVLFIISRCFPDSALVGKCRELGLTLIVGNTHAFEVMENGLPLAYAMQEMLPDCEIYLLRDRVTSTPVREAGNEALREYARMIAQTYLVNKE